jgi:iron(III) transport system substrate-binding protein
VYVNRRALLKASLSLLPVAIGAACGRGVVTPSETADTSEAEPTLLTVYSGRNENLVGPLLEQFEKDTGIAIQVKYGGTAEIAATILEEGANSPADVFYAQDAGALGALQAENRLAALPDAVLNAVEPRFRSPQGQWVGTSGRARVVVYNTESVKPEDLPPSILDFTDPMWKGRIGWAPTNGSFQAFVTAMRVTLGDDRTRAWLEGIKANKPMVYTSNTPTVQAAVDGEIAVGFVNHYYLFRIRAEQGNVPAENYFPPNGDLGALINVAGASVIAGTKNQAAAEQFVAYLLAQQAQEYFATETYEYPLAHGVAAHSDLPPLAAIQTPDIDLSDLADLRGTLQLLQEVELI